MTHTTAHSLWQARHHLFRFVHGGVSQGELKLDAKHHKLNF